METSNKFLSFWRMRAPSSFLQHQHNYCISVIPEHRALSKHWALSGSPQAKTKENIFLPFWGKGDTPKWYSGDLGVTSRNALPWRPYEAKDFFSPLGTFRVIPCSSLVEHIVSGFRLWSSIMFILYPGSLSHLTSSRNVLKKPQRLWFQCLDTNTQFSLTLKSYFSLISEVKLTSDWLLTAFIFLSVKGRNNTFAISVWGLEDS